jgi:hypothetical protein
MPLLLKRSTKQQRPAHVPSSSLTNAIMGGLQFQQQQQQHEPQPSTFNELLPKPQTSNSNAMNSNGSNASSSGFFLAIPQHQQQHQQQQFHVEPATTARSWGNQVVAPQWPAGAVPVSNVVV